MLRNFLKGTAVVLAMGMAFSSAHADEGISVANGKVKFNALTQFWFVNDTSLGHQVNAAGHQNGAEFNMLINRAELHFSGALSDTTRWMVAFDPTTTNIVRDIFISQQVMMPGLDFTVGNFKILTVAESLDPAGELLLPQRSMVARTWGESRQPGAMLSYRTNMWKIAGMISNGQNTVGNDIAGSGNNASDVDNGTEAHPNNKDLTFRFDIKPMEMVSAGAFTYFPDFNWGQGGAFGGDLRVMPIEDLVVRGEYVRGWVADAAGNHLARNGYYVDAAYQYGDFQPVARYEIQQQGAAGSVVTGSALTFGLNYYMMKHNSKIQFAYTILGDHTSGSDVTDPTAAGGFNSATGNYAPTTKGGGGLAILAFQTAI